MMRYQAIDSLLFFSAYCWGEELGLKLTEKQLQPFERTTPHSGVPFFE